MKYRKEIDGLRAISVVAVILFHAGFSVFSGGFVGVDIFFVISGYLITNIIIEDKTNSSFTFANFYERRARRILPALFTVLFISLPFAWLWLPPIDMKSMSQSLMAVIGFSSNIYFYSSTGYFDTAAEWKPLLHTWSLALEEQFYFIFPIFLTLTWRLGKRFVFFLLVLLAVASLLVAQWNSVHNIPAGFYLLPSRGWELLIGASASFYVSIYGTQHFNKTLEQLGSFLGLLLIAGAILLLDKKSPSLGAYALIPTLGAVLVILFSTPQTAVGKLLSTPLFVGVGLISYSVYLWHWPFFVFARYKSIPEAPSDLLFICLSFAAIVAGFLTWKFIENPFRKKQKIKRNNVLALSDLCSVFFVAIGFEGYSTKGFASRIPNVAIQAPIEFPSNLNGWCFYEPDLSPEFLAGAQGVNCWLGNKTAVKKALLLGDSIAGNYEPFWDAVGKKSNVAIHPITTNYCVPAINEIWTGPLEWKAKQQCFYNRQYFIDNVANYDIAILAGNWMDYSTKNNMNDVLAFIDVAASKTKLVVLMAAPKAYDINPVVAYNQSLLNQSNFDIASISAVRDNEQYVANKLLEETAKRYNNVLYVGRDSLYTVDGVASEVTKEKIPFGFDSLHISIYGSLSAAACFLDSQKYKDFISMQVSH